jgi:hypothetical protein
VTRRSGDVDASRGEAASARNGRVWLPGTLYEALPYTYIAVGVLTFLFFDDAYATLSAISLVFAGLVVIWWRKSCRQDALRQAEIRRHRLRKLRLAERNAALER